MSRAWILGAALLLLPGCYTVAFDTPVPETQAVAATERVAFVVTPQTRETVYGLHAFNLGIANRWKVPIGAVFADYARTLLLPRFAGAELLEAAPGAGFDRVVTLEIERYAVNKANIQGFLTVRAKSRDAAGTEAATTIETVGTTQTGLSFWGGAFGAKAAIRRGTDPALRAAMDRIAEWTRHPIAATPLPGS